MENSSWHLQKAELKLAYAGLQLAHAEFDLARAYHYQTDSHLNNRIHNTKWKPKQRMQKPITTKQSPGCD